MRLQERGKIKDGDEVQLSVNCLKACDVREEKKRREEEKRRHGCALLDVLHCGRISLCRNVFY